MTSPARVLADFWAVPPLPAQAFEGLAITRGRELDGSFLELVEGLLSDCMSDARPTITEGGFLERGVEPESAFLPLRTLAPWAIPLTLPPLGAPQKGTRFAKASHAAAFTQLTRMFFSTAEPTSISHPARGTTSVPEWSTDRGRKIELIEGILRDLPQILRLVEEGELSLIHI